MGEEHLFLVGKQSQLLSATVMYVFYVLFGPGIAVFGVTPDVTVAAGTDTAPVS